MPGVSVENISSSLYACFSFHPNDLLPTPYWLTLMVPPMRSSKHKTNSFCGWADGATCLNSSKRSVETDESHQSMIVKGFEVVHLPSHKKKKRTFDRTQFSLQVGDLASASVRPWPWWLLRRPSTSGAGLLGRTAWFLPDWPVGEQPAENIRLNQNVLAFLVNFWLVSERQ